MQTFEPMRQLAVSRCLSDGTRRVVGRLAQNRFGIYFAYDGDYLSKFGNLSPFLLQETTSPQLETTGIFFGLHGVFADSLPDGWGLMLQDRYFRQQGILPHLVTPLDRLAFVGERGIGALSFEPVIFGDEQISQMANIGELGRQAQLIFDGEIEELYGELLLAGSSGGARPKAQIFMNQQATDVCRTTPNIGDEAWIIKFTSQNLPLGHEEGLCEAVYLQMAENAGIYPAKHRLIVGNQGSRWLAVQRFDVVNGCLGRMHTHSVAGLLGVNFRLPTLEYADLIKMSRLLCKSSSAGRLQFRRAIFNLLTLNQDDHAKNFAFIQDDDGHWQPSPAYDLTFSPTRFGEHSTSFLGYGKNPPKKAIETLAKNAGYDKWAEVKQDIEQIVNAIDFSNQAKLLGVKSDTIKLIQKELNQVYQNNKSWIVS